jgi:hypothetical protein
MDPAQTFVVGLSVGLRFYVPPFAEARRMGHPNDCGWFECGWVFVPPFAEARRMGHPNVCGWFKCGVEVLRPTLRKGAKDGAPERLWLV